MRNTAAAIMASAGFTEGAGQARREGGHAMRGFDDEFEDCVDYILRITDRIWADKNIGSIRRYYAPDCVIHTLAGPVCGSEAVVNATIRTLAAFPDRRLLAEDVIWSGDEDAGFYTSHRIISPAMTQLGHSELGPPSGRQATVRTIADCLIRANRIQEEWLVRDNMSLALQLGLDVEELANRLAATITCNEALQSWLRAEIERLAAGPAQPVPPRPAEPVASLGEFAEHVVRGLWEQGDSDVAGRSYAARSRLHGPGRRELEGPGQIAAAIAAVGSCLSNPRASIDHLCALPAADGGYRVALRWTLTGRHSRPGIYGGPNDREVLVLACSHWHLSDGLIQEEWLVFDELALLAQMRA